MSVLKAVESGAFGARIEREMVKTNLSGSQSEVKVRTPESTAPPLQGLPTNLAFPTVVASQARLFAGDLAAELRKIVSGSSSSPVFESYQKLSIEDLGWLAGYGSSRELQEALKSRLHREQSLVEPSNVYEFFINRNLDNGSSGQTLYSLVYDLNDGRLIGVVERQKWSGIWGKPTVTRTFDFSERLSAQTSEGFLAIIIEDFIKQQRAINGERAKFLLRQIRGN